MARGRMQRNAHARWAPHATSAHLAGRYHGVSSLVLVFGPAVSKMVRFVQDLTWKISMKSRTELALPHAFLVLTQPQEILPLDVVTALHVHLAVFSDHLCVVLWFSSQNFENYFDSLSHHGNILRNYSHVALPVCCYHAHHDHNTCMHIKVTCANSVFSTHCITHSQRRCIATTFQNGMLTQLHNGCLSPARV